MREGSGKTVLILGCGYLGVELAAQAARLGWAVKAVSRNEETLQRAAESGAQVCQAMVGSDVWHDFAGEELDSVVNCVGSAGNGLAGYRESYLEGNRSLARWARSIGFGGRVVFTSSVSVYPDYRGGWVDEAHTEAPSRERGQLMLEAESILSVALKPDQLCLLRLGGLYGPGRHLMLNTLMPGPERMPGWGDYHLNLIRLEDAAAAVLLCLENTWAPAGIYNIVDDEPALKESIVAWIAAELGTPVPVFEACGESPKAGSRRFGEDGRPSDRRIANRRFREVYGWQPVYGSFREGFGQLLSGSAGSRKV